MKKRNKILLTILIIIIAVVCIGSIVYYNIEAKLNNLADLPISDVDLTKLDDGVYSGSYSTFPITAEVKVIIKDHQITKIDLVKHTNGQGQAAEVLPGRVVEAQSLDVDAITGATYSSKVILKAIENALNSDVVTANR